jgi:hypothetical protein
LFLLSTEAAAGHEERMKIVVALTKAGLKTAIGLSEFAMCKICTLQIQQLLIN